MDWLSRLYNRLLDDYVKRFLSVEEWSFAIQHVIDSLVVIGLAFCAMMIARFILRKVVWRIDKVSHAAYRRKIETISSLVYSMIKYTIIIATSLWILTIWGVNTQNLVVGSAIVGAAIGFGSQGLVQDIITGLSILAEDQLSIGDYVEIAGKAGVVEEIGLRVVKLRDPNGVQHVIFNRNISLVSNYGGGSVQAIVDISLAKFDDGVRAREIAERTGRDLALEIPILTEPPTVEGLIENSNKEVFLRVHVHVLPQKDAAVNDLFVERIKRAFAAAEPPIEIPGNRVQIVFLSKLFKKVIKRVDPNATVQEKAVGGDLI